ncbi:MAG TPA: saccharopine dehydrogenase NADP-binding domain-containing protein [Kofleriaceae bacterium]|nr:saccharopine dehydrogenase NADP-binding domain-containing protein [Kofleriaceae bacterium]
MRDFDLVLLGATGFTGKLVAQYLDKHAMRWALAGRNRDKLEDVKRSLTSDVPIIVADALDPAACESLAARTKVLCTTVGPYTKYGSEVVGACAAAGTHYCDLTGEVSWMRTMIDAHHETARKTGARIVHASGFDSIPSDLGTWATQQEFIARFGAPAHSVTAYYGAISGGFSGGTAGSMFVIADAMENREVRRVLGNPYGLDPDPRAARPPAPDDKAPRWDATVGMFTVPFVMAATNSRVVRRAHALAGFPWGEDFIYREVMTTPKSAKGLAMAAGITAGLGTLAVAMRSPKLRKMLEARAPKSGEGPDEQTRKRGHWTVHFVAQRDGERLDYVVADPHGDPGYASTSKMLGESAMCLAFDPLASQGGVTTPSVAMGGALQARLVAAGLEFHAM